MPEMSLFFAKPVLAATTVILAAMVIVGESGSSSAASVSSNLGEAVDGNTVILDGRQFRLHGVRAPKPGFKCTIRGSERDCGRIARAALLDLMAGAHIVCESITASAFRCTADGYDLSQGMVYVGYAVPIAGAPALYRQELKRAQDRRHGLWRAKPTLTVNAILNAAR